MAVHAVTGRHGCFRVAGRPEIPMERQGPF